MYKKTLLFACMISLCVPLLFAHSASAHHGDDDEVDTSQHVEQEHMDDSQMSQMGGSASTNSEDKPHASGRAKTERTLNTKSRTENEVESHNEVHSDQAEQRGKQILSALVANKKPRSAEDVQKSCTQRKAAIDKRVARLNIRAASAQAKISTVFNKGQAYQKANKLSSDQIAAALQNANSAQAKAQTAVTSLEGTEPVVDCASSDNAAKLATYKAAIEQTRDALKLYRAAVKGYLVSLTATTKGN